MSKAQAIASCRVSSDEQLKNNSLTRQRASVLAAAERLDVAIPQDGWWSGSVSSKRGNNLKRKDIQEMLSYCKKNPAVKYLIVDEPDRFMRSIDEAMYLEMEFKLLGVKVWYASDDELNNDDMTAKLMKFMKYFVAEGGNEERQRKSIAGLTRAIQEGRYPFPPPIGYKRGSKAGVHDIDPVLGPLVKDILFSVAEGLMSPSDAVRMFNDSEHVRNRQHCQYKLDKFRVILTNPYYAGIVEMNRQVQYRNENGLHKPLITKAQHEELLRIVNGKAKNQKGPRKNGNPKYILNGAICEACQNERIGKLIGFDHTNGKTAKIYERYRCRSCRAYFKLHDLHPAAKRRLESLHLAEQTRKRFIAILGDVWQQNEENKASEKATMSRQIIDLEKELDNHAAAIANPSNELIKERLLKIYNEKQETVESLKEKRDSIDKIKTADKERFLKFALDYVDDLGGSYFDALAPEKREVCKQILFPAGFWVSPTGEVYTPQVSAIYRLATNKKDLSVTEKSLMVRVRGL